MAELPVEELRARIRAVQREKRLPSLVGAIFHRGELVWSEAVGLADVEAERLVTVEDQFRIGSITKTFVAVAIMQLRDEGLLTLDDPLQLHVEEAPQSGVTIRRLLAHSAGLQREPVGNVWATLDLPDREQFLASLAESEQVLAPGLAHHYSNLAFVLLGDDVAPRLGPWRGAHAQRRVDPRRPRGRHARLPRLARVRAGDARGLGRSHEQRRQRPRRRARGGARGQGGIDLRRRRRAVAAGRPAAGGARGRARPLVERG
jgi:hypothetical protein